MKKRFILFSCIAFLFLIYSGCTKKAPDYTRELSKDSGNIVNFGNMELILPLGSLLAEGSLTINKIKPVDLPEGSVAIGEAYAIELNQTLNSPAYLSLFFTTNTLPSSYEVKNFAVLKKSDSGWTAPENQLVDIGGQKVSFPIKNGGTFLCVAKKGINNSISLSNLNYSSLPVSIKEDLSANKISGDEVINSVEVIPEIHPSYDTKSEILTRYFKDILSRFTTSSTNITVLTKLIKDKISIASGYKEVFDVDIDLYEEEWNKPAVIVEEENFIKSNNSLDIYKQITDWVNKKSSDKMIESLSVVVDRNIINNSDNSTGNLYLIYSLSPLESETMHRTELRCYFHDKKINKYSLYYRQALISKISIGGSPSAEGSSSGEKGSGKSFSKVQLSGINPEEFAGKLSLTIDDVPVNMIESANAWIDQAPFPTGPLSEIRLPEYSYLGTQNYGFTYKDFGGAFAGSGKLLSMTVLSLLFANSDGASAVLKIIKNDISSEDLMGITGQPLPPEIQLTSKTRKESYGEESLYYLYEGVLTQQGESTQFYTTTIIFRIGPVVSFFNSLSVKSLNEKELGSILKLMELKISRALEAL